MFSRLKQKLKEESSGDGVINSINNTNTNNSINKSEINVKERNLNSSYSNTQSSDETNVSVKSEQLEATKPKEKSDDEEVGQTRDLFTKHATTSLPMTLQLQELNQSLLNQIETLTNEIKQKLDENETLREELNKQTNKIEFYEFENEKIKIEYDNCKLICEKYESEIKRLKNEKDDLLVKNAELSQKYELLKLVNNKQSNLPNHETFLPMQINPDSPNLHTCQTINYNTKDSLNSNEDVNSTPDTRNYMQQMEENKSLRDDLNEKNKVIKNLQQRLNDMKKTLQKELKFQSLPNENNQNESKEKKVDLVSVKKPTHSTQQQQQEKIHINNEKINESIFQTPSSTSDSKIVKRSSSNFSLPITSSNNKNNTSSQLSNLHDDVNFKYLKHVVLKFLISREYEALHLIKALSVLLNFTNDEEKILKETLEWKMSWFGVRPKIH